MREESNPLTTGKPFEGNENLITQARALEREGNLVGAAKIFEQEGKPIRATGLYKKCFTQGCLEVDSFLEEGRPQEAIGLWLRTRDAYTEMRRIEDANNLEIEDSDELMERFSKMAEKMRPFLVQE